MKSKLLKQLIIFVTILSLFNVSIVTAAADSIPCIETGSRTIYVGESFQPTIANIMGQNILSTTWKSSKPSVAKVKQDGTIIGKKAGQSNITCIVAYTDIYKVKFKFTLYVKNKTSDNKNDNTSKNKVSSKQKTSSTYCQGIYPPVEAVKKNNYKGYDKTSKATLKAIRKVTKPLMKSSVSRKKKVKAVHDWLVNNTSYDYENLNAGTLPMRAYGLMGPMLDGKAVCNGYALAFEFMMNVLDVPCYFVSGVAVNASGAEPVGHAWNRVKIKGKWYYLDVTWDDPVSSVDILSYDYYLSKKLWSDHAVDEQHMTDKQYCDFSYVLKELR